MLADSEPFDRGLFAGPFGWLSGAAAEFAVAIRSALITPGGSLPHLGDVSGLHELKPSLQNAADALMPTQIVSVFAGVGIVKGSQPLSEWQVRPSGLFFLFD